MKVNQSGSLLFLNGLLFAALTLCVHFSVAQENEIAASFSSSVRFGTQKNNLSVLVSSDFNGNYAIDGIRKAGWKEITGSFKLAKDTEAVPYGKASLSAYAKAGKPLYVAFKYIGKASEKPTQRSWSIQDLVLSNGQSEIPASPTSLKIVNSSKNHEGAGWKITKPGTIVHLSNRSTVETESWLIWEVQVPD